MKQHTVQVTDSHANLEKPNVSSHTPSNSGGPYEQFNLPSLQFVPVPFAPDLRMIPNQQQMIPPEQRTPHANMPSHIQKPIAHHPPKNMGQPRFSNDVHGMESTSEQVSPMLPYPLSMRGSSMSRSSSISSNFSQTMENKLSTALTFQEETSPRRTMDPPPSFRNSKRVSALPATQQHYQSVAQGPPPAMHAFVLQQNQQPVQWAPDMSQGAPTHLMPGGDHQSRRRVTLAVADLPSYGKAKPLRRGSLLANAKKRKRSANISELTFSKLYKKDPPHNLIRIWVNERNMQFYDCQCGRRKAVQDLQKIIRHAEKCTYTADIENPLKSVEAANNAAKTQSPAPEASASSETETAAKSTDVAASSAADDQAAMQDA